MDERFAKEGGRGAQRAREAAAAEVQAAEAAAEEAEHDAAMQGIREQAEGAMAGTGASDSFDVLEPAAMQPLFAPATPSASAQAAGPARLADAAAGGAAELRAMAGLCRRLQSGARSSGSERMEADNGDDAHQADESAAGLVLAAYPYCPGAAAAEAASSAASPSAAEAAGRGALRVLASAEAAERTAVVLGAGVALLARMGARDPALAAASDAPVLVGGVNDLGGIGSGAAAAAVWAPSAHDFIVLFGALGYGAAFGEAGATAGSSSSSSSAAAGSTSTSPTPRGAAAVQVALRVLRHALELHPSAVLSPPTAANVEALATPELCAVALTCGLMRLRLDPSARAAALPALDAALAAALAAVEPRDWPAVCGAAAALAGAPIAPSHRAALVLLQELPTGRTPRAAQLQAAGALVLLRTLAHCLRSGGDPSALGAAGAAGGTARRGKRGGGGGAAAVPVSVWPTAKDVIEVLNAAGGARSFFAPVNAASGPGGGAGAPAAGGRGGADGDDDDEDDDEAAAAATAAPAPGTRATAAAAYWAAMTAVDAADMVLWSHVDGSLARARAAEDAGLAVPGGTGAWTRSAGSAWSKWLGEAGQQLRRTIWMHALRARIGELEHTYELVAGGVAAGC
jgi:hypothetical protein